MTLKNGTKVKVEYTGTLDDGKIFDTTEGRGPLEFEIGASQVIPAFENAVKEMKVGEEKEVSIPSEKAYGEVRKELIKAFPRNQLPEGIKEGTVLGLTLSNGAQVPARVVKVTDTEVVINLNHPLAGKNLNFKIKLVSTS